MFNRLFLLLVALALAACNGTGEGEPAVLRLATTTSTNDSGLLDEILPDFEQQYNARVDVIAVGTGQAIALGEAGDADVILVHARAREDAFVAGGHGQTRRDVMFNDFIIVGPSSDPAGVQGTRLAADALATIAAAEAPFASRGDDSGTHTMELSLWSAADYSPAAAEDWYFSLGQGMGDTLTFANETGAYTLTDRGTFLFQQQNLPNLAIMVGGDTIAGNADPALLNPYGVIPVNPDKGGLNSDLAEQFAQWLTSPAVQDMIGQYGTDQFDQPLFYPDAE
ncbi:MAG: substrate-binding domain-containing protein [Chloroflexota bacterium]